MLPWNIANSKLETHFESLCSLKNDPRTRLVSSNMLWYHDTEKMLEQIKQTEIRA
jgi:hypothetical protein